MVPVKVNCTTKVKKKNSPFLQLFLQMGFALLINLLFVILTDKSIVLHLPIPTLLSFAQKWILIGAGRIEKWRELILMGPLK